MAKERPLYHFQIPLNNAEKVGINNIQAITIASLIYNILYTNNEQYIIKFVVSDCKGVTFEPSDKQWTLRKSDVAQESSTGEISVILKCLGKYLKYAMNKMKMLSTISVGCEIKKEYIFS